MVLSPPPRPSLGSKEFTVIEFTAQPTRAEQGDGAGPVLASGQRGDGQSILLDGIVSLAGGSTAPVQVEVRVGSQNDPLNFSDDKQYTVTVEEVV